MPTLLEAAITVGLSAAIMMLVSASLAATTRIHALASSVAGELFVERQLEQLVDRASLASGAGPMHPAPLSSVSADTVVFAADANGDGVVDSSSSETTALEVRRSSGRTSVRLRLGRQTMTVLDAGSDRAAVTAFDRYGNVAAAASATLVGLDVTDEHAEPPVTRRMLFSLPARTLR